MDDRILRELIYLARSNDPVALRSLYAYYDALVNTVMRKMKYISSMSLEAQDLLQVGMITFDKVFWSYREDLDTTFEVYARSCIIKKMQSLLKKQYTFFTRYEKKAISLDRIVNYDDSRTYGELIADQRVEYSPQKAQDLEKVWELVYAIIQNETSERDQKIFHLVLLGYPEKEVALMLNISIKCVYNSVYRVMSKLRAHPLGEFLIIN
ncbi:MAG: sigma-70 family RNA polymerase sigma factor [Catenibacterium mitsuokai]|jgi:RNA polymerase sigma factor (sigma-70 family)|uniref:sigma-70 family RNA polymerase sigma factor n=1 Tax=Catenibacterium TaxID=135858 RepID=UPI0006C0C719|nr:sigma-70 family RNA polymerase sigma factor [Catenibacterium mitsuokai]CUP45825.1 RNA polymerase factor sigma-70 [Roseburia hominis]MCI6076949.1 sigma-70 family RNA polymerase sigma factor [Catenibacterium mitsuokai]MDD6595042.1 sigma-70 family RNA polymerase sigma factor [Catenibacterium mitsuokai]MDY3676411.1 sigma-70 family RNA polymerase sigma factor [Catenibacterium mitsuokai]MEE0082199.1 sigma-70 family RNA polymerase sigma factor [Catenibacterium mitsuokai]